MNLYILGGRPCTGKTTLAYLFGKKYKIAVEHVDIFAQECIDSADETMPYSFKLKGKDLVEIMSASPKKLLDDYISFYEEIFPKFVEKLSLNTSNSLILEGSIFLPKLIKLLEEKHNVDICYMFAEDDFVRERYLDRDYVQSMLLKPNGKDSVENLLKRDCLFNNYLLDELQLHAYPIIPVALDDFESEAHSIESYFDFKL